MNRHCFQPARLPSLAFRPRISTSRVSPFLPLRLGRLQSTGNAPRPARTQQAVKAASFASRGRVPSRYPERLLVFHSPTPVTAFIGSAKVATMIVFGAGCLIAAPNVYANPESPWWMVPAVIVAGSIPMVMISLMTAPFVAGVFIRVPESARISKDALVAFARKLPQDTRLDVQKMGFLPLPRTRVVKVSELRPLPPSLKYLANFEHVPAANAGVHTTGWQNYARGLLRYIRGFLWMRPTPSHWEKTPAPEVWPQIVEHVNRNNLRIGLANTAAPAKASKPWMTPASPTRLARGPRKAVLNTAAGDPKRQPK